MKIPNVRHKGLRRLFDDGKVSGLPAEFVDKIGKILGFLQDMEKPEELLAMPAWKAHQLTGDRTRVPGAFRSRRTGALPSGSMKPGAGSSISITKITTD